MIFVDERHSCQATHLRPLYYRAAIPPRVRRRSAWDLSFFSSNPIWGSIVQAPLAQSATVTAVRLYSRPAASVRERILTFLDGIHVLVDAARSEMQRDRDRLEAAGNGSGSAVNGDRAIVIKAR